MSYGDTTIDSVNDVPPLPAEENISLWEDQDEPVDAFTLMHHDLDVCTNSLQYAMLLDIVNNLLLYVEPHRKQALERYEYSKLNISLRIITTFPSDSFE